LARNFFVVGKIIVIQPFNVLLTLNFCIIDNIYVCCKADGEYFANIQKLQVHDQNELEYDILKRIP